MYCLLNKILFKFAVLNLKQGAGSEIACIPILSQPSYT